MRQKVTSSLPRREGRKTGMVHLVPPHKKEKEMADETGKTCPTCKQRAKEHGHLCVPATKKDEKCNWCGSLILNERHLCKDKVQELSYICNSCGRAAVSADYLCKPSKI